MEPFPVSDLFSSLKAEHEPWLLQGFVRPQGCDQAGSTKSLIIWGAPGSGKSALRMKLADEIPQDYMAAHWSPEPPRDDSLQGTPLFNFALTQALRTCIETLVLKGDLHHRLGDCDEWIQQSLASFMHKYLPQNPKFYIQSRAKTLGQEQTAWYSALLASQPQEVLNENTTNEDLLNLLFCTINAAGYQSFYLYVDGLEKWNGFSDERVGQMMDSILSTLAVFDNANLIFKFFVPESFRSRLEITAGVVKYRVGQLNVKWDAERLSDLLIQRVGLGLGREISKADFCSDEYFWGWMSNFGGQNPRTWLELARPFAAHFLLESGKTLSYAVCRELVHGNPPLLRTGAQKVWLGELALTDVTATEYDLLAYLEKNQGRNCSLEEIFYLGLEKLNQLPGKNDVKWLEKDEYRGVVDTAVYRLRHKLEPDPAKPIYVVTEHGKGIQLYPRGNRKG